MTEIPQEYKLTNEEIKRMIVKELCRFYECCNWKQNCFNPEVHGDFGKCDSVKHAENILAVAMPLIEKRAREEIAKEIFDFQLLALHGDLEDAHRNRDQYDNDPHWASDKLVVYKEFWRGFSQHTANIIDAIEVLKLKYLGQSLRESK